MFQSLKNIYHLLQAAIAAIIFRFPSKKLVVIGVTGTDGKTTTVTMIHHILQNLNQKSAMVTSVKAVIGKSEINTGFHVTTPSSWKIQRLLRQAKDSGVKYFILETTSHGLDQNRLAFVHFTSAVLTNISPEHLDYHKTMDNYKKAKLRLFKKVQYSILNKDDVSFNFFKSNASGKIITYSLENKSAQVNLSNTPIKLKVKGRYNLENALAAHSAVFTQGFSRTECIKALKDFDGVEGRLQEVNLGQNFTAIVDFAHTPNSLKNALLAIEQNYIKNKSKIIAVFGAAGKRDSKKRPLMGKIATKYADFLIITSEDPRSENPATIANEIVKGFENTNWKKGIDYLIELDRKKAIQKAVELAESGDVVCFFGKGHEKSMCIKNIEYPWDEVQTVKDAIKGRIKNEK